VRTLRDGRCGGVTAWGLATTVWLAPLLCVVAAHRPADEVLTLWPGAPPGTSSGSGKEHKLEGRPRPFFQLTDISVPRLEVYFAPAERRFGAAVLVCPGGGLQRLAYEHEGLEVAEWLNANGVDAGVLKYRVPAPAHTALMDAQRAMGLLRSNAQRWRVDPASVGFLGFSAGGEIGAWLITHAKGREYPAVDAADQQSCRPDWAGLIYSGGLVSFGGGLKGVIATNLDRLLPPVFLAQAADDAAENSLALALALKRAGAPLEVHVYRAGAHGFGVRPSGVAAGGWKDQLLVWLDALGHLDSLAVREMAKEVLADSAAGRAGLAERLASLEDAYAVQRRVVWQRQAGDRVAGYKGVQLPTHKGSVKSGGELLTGVLFSSGRTEASTPVAIERAAGASPGVVAGVGYVMGVDFSFEVPTDAHMRDAVAGIVPVIELPAASKSASSEAAALRNRVASNLDASRYLVGPTLKPEGTDPGSWKISIVRDGRPWGSANRSSGDGEPWRQLRAVVNQLTARGYTLRAGDLIVCEDAEWLQPGEPGHYEAKFGETTTLRFEIR